jgi:hypothetical protein
MSNTTKQTENEIRYCIVEGGHDADPDPDMAGRVRLRDIQRHGPGVKTEHLPWSQLLSNPQGAGQKEFNRPPDPGQIVVCMVPKGGGTTGYKHVFGIPLGKEEAQAAIPGNMSFPWAGLQDFKKQTLKISVPPDVKQQTENDKVIYKIQEKGQKYMRALADGLPSHIASYILAQSPVQEHKNVPTAVSQQSERLTSGMMGMLGGSMFSMSSLSSLVGSIGGGGGGSGGGGSGSVQQQNLQQAFDNAMTLIQSSNDTEGPGNGLNNQFVVNEAVFNTKVQELFAGVTNYQQLDDALRTVMRDESIRGLDQLPDATISTTGPFGELTLTLSANGAVSNTESNTTKQNKSAFSGSGGGGLGGIFAGSDKLFGSQLQKMAELAGRLPTAAKVQQKIQEMKDLGNTKSARQKQNEGGSSTTSGTSLSAIFSSGSFSTTLQHVTQWAGTPESSGTS